MTQAEECILAYDFLTQVLKDYGLDDIVAEIEDEMQSDETISYEDIPDDTDNGPEALVMKRKSKASPLGQTMLPGIVASFPSPSFSLDTFYSPQRRLHILIDAIERAVAEPVLMGEYVLKVLKQESITLGSHTNNEPVFVLRNEDIQRNRESAHDLHKLLQALRKHLLSEEHP